MEGRKEGVRYREESRREVRKERGREKGNEGGKRERERMGRGGSICGPQKGSPLRARCVLPGGREVRSSPLRRGEQRWKSVAGGGTLREPFYSKVFLPHIRQGLLKGRAHHNRRREL